MKSARQAKNLAYTRTAYSLLFRKTTY